MSELPQAKQLVRSVRADAASQEVREGRLRRWVAVIALMQVMEEARRSGLIRGFLLKGGTAVEMRLHTAARASRDADVVVDAELVGLPDVAVELLRISWAGFSFRAKKPLEQRPHVLKAELGVSYQGADWTSLELELSVGSTVGADRVVTVDLKRYGLPQAVSVPCMCVEEQIAQKLHAVSDPRENRPRDLVDIHVLAKSVPCDNAKLQREIVRVFAERNAHRVPLKIEIREGWDAEISGLIAKFRLPLTTDEVIGGVANLFSSIANGTEVLNPFRR